MYRVTAQAKNPLVVAFLSLLTGGGGQIYLGQTTKGISIIIGWWILGIPTLFTVPFILSVTGAIDAYLLAKRIEQFGQVAEWEFFWTTRIAPKSSIWRVESIVPTGLSQQIIGSQFMDISNSTSTSAVKRTVQVAREWTKSYAFEFEKAWSSTGEIAPHLMNSSMVRYEIQKLTRDKHSFTKSEGFRHQETIQVVVPAGKNLRLQLTWKHILQKYAIDMSDQFGNKIVMPMSVIIGLTFDQTQINE